MAVLEEALSHCHSFHHETHIDCSGIEPRPSLYQKSEGDLNCI